ncbi:MAG TPA: hypothetical protein VFN37_10625 [Candidatus Baltobacteraceae bacterium]|nr:hypothetical protein [Candidatus Baltobacteraceae bacterium]
MMHALLLSSLIGAAGPAPAARAALAVKLAQAIAGEHGAVDTRIYVGELPAGAPPPAPLPKYTLLGSVVQAVRMSETGDVHVYTVYYETPDAQNALDAYGKTLAALGWHEPPMQKAVAQVLAPEGGFAVSSPLAAAMHVHHMYCSSKGFLETAVLSSPARTLTISYGAGAQAATLCAITTMAGAIFGPPAPSPPPLPSLSAPAGVTMHASLGLADLLTPVSRAALTTASPIAAVGAEFAKQLVASGWQALPAAAGETAYVQTFTKNQQGRHYQAVLSFISSGKPQQYDAAVSERDLDRPAQPAGFPLPF